MPREGLIAIEKTVERGGSDVPDGKVVVKLDPRKLSPSDMVKAMNAIREAERRKRGLPV
jgi:hypothetical protein